MRRIRDTYFTSAKDVEELTKRVHIRGVVLEPCCGSNRIVDKLNQNPETIAKGFDLVGGYDARFKETWARYPIFNWIITNPPFSSAYFILNNAIESKARVAFLLRLSFLEPTYERQEFLNQNPPSKLIILPRYSFTEDGKTDSVTCAWMLWNYKDDKPIEVVLKS